MFELQNWIVGVSLGYYWTGFEMLKIDSSLHPMNRPAYTKNPLYKRVISIMLWPFVTRLNFEFGFFFSFFISYTVVITFLYSMSSEFLLLWQFVLAVTVLRLIPIVRVVFNAPAALIASIIYMFLSKVFGLKVPSAIDRMRSRK